jgi:hypothetical protein
MYVGRTAAVRKLHMGLVRELTRNLSQLQALVALLIFAVAIRPQFTIKSTYYEQANKIR